MVAAMTTAISAPRPRTARTLSPRARRAVLTAHIVASVGLLGDVAAVLAVNIRAATTSDPALAHSSYELLQMFSAVFGIPLSFTALITGVTLGLGTKWGVFRHPVGDREARAAPLGDPRGGVRDRSRDERHAQRSGRRRDTAHPGRELGRAALTAATALSVYKPTRARAARPRSGGARGPRG